MFMAQQNVSDSSYQLFIETKLFFFQALDVDLAEGDTVTVYNGRETDSGQIIVMFGADWNNTIEVVTSTGDNLLVTMETVSAQPGRGFQFEYYLGQ